MAINLTHEQYKLFYRIVSHAVPKTRGEVSDMQHIFRKSRAWFRREEDKYSLHPAVKELLIEGVYPCTSGAHELRHYIKDWREMLLEWPHISTTDVSRLAYTQSDEKGQRDQQTVTSLQKYLKRHMPQCPDHTLRDFCTPYVVDLNHCHITTDMDKMIDVIERGPRSCMQGFNNSAENPHPYRVYAPALGWGLAYRTDTRGEYIGRALVNTADGEKIFVRTYKRMSSGYSQADEVLEAYLKGQGYKHADSWYDKKLAKIQDTYGRERMVYLDGGDDYLEDCGDHWRICDGDEGDYQADLTTGYLGDDAGEACDDCGDYYHEDELHGTGFYGEHRVCPHCLENYTYVYGRGRDQYYVADSEAVYCESDGDMYHDRYVDEWGVIWVESANGYYLTDYTWECAGSNEIYTDDVPSYEVDGEYYHEDYLPDGWEVVDGQLRRVDEDEEEQQAA